MALVGKTELSDLVSTPMCVDCSLATWLIRTLRILVEQRFILKFGSRERQMIFDWNCSLKSLPKHPQGLSKLHLLKD